MILHFFITVLFIYGVHATTRDGMIFSGFYMRVLYLADRWMGKPEKILKPLFDCTPCMASVYGTISFFIVLAPGPLVLSDPSTYIYLTTWIVWVFSLAGFNYILNKILNR